LPLPGKKRGKGERKGEPQQAVAGGGRDYQTGSLLVTEAAPVHVMEPGKDDFLKETLTSSKAEETRKSPRAVEEKGAARGKKASSLTLIGKKKKKHQRLIEEKREGESGITPSRSWGHEKNRNCLAQKNSWWSAGWTEKKKKKKSFDSPQRFSLGGGSP